jgi:preprotein translocase subunit SecD
LVKALNQLNVEPDFDSLSPIVAYVHRDSTLQLSVNSSENISLLKTAYTVDEDKEFYALIAVKNPSALTNKDIQKTKPNQSNIKVFMNLQGAKKWADLTKRNVGEMIAIAVDNEIYTLTTIKSEIRNGVAIIGGIESTKQAIEISNSLNGLNN